MISLTITTANLSLPELEQVAWEGLQRGTLYYWQKVQEALNISNPGERRKSARRKTPSGRKASYTVYASPSAPGDPPRKRTGWLQRNVRYAFDRKGLSSRVGVGANAKYGLYLELGTKRMAARPWLMATLNRHMEQVTALMGGA